MAVKNTILFTVYAQIRIIALHSNSKKLYWYECLNTLMPKVEIKIDCPVAM